MSDPKWISAEDVAEINRAETELTNEPFEVLKPGELESACDRARNHFAYGETDIHRLAATYAEGIAQNHPFAQGNKRAAFGAADLFLFENGVALLPRTDDGYVNMMLGLVNGELSRDEVANYLVENSREIVQEQALEKPERDDLLRDYDEQPAQDEHENSRDHDMADDD